MSLLKFRFSMIVDRLFNSAENFDNPGNRPVPYTGYYTPFITLPEWKASIPEESLEFIGDLSLLGRSEYLEVPFSRKPRMTSEQVSPENLRGFNF